MLDLNHFKMYIIPLGYILHSLNNQIDRTA